MNNQTPRAGDKALVINPLSAINGRVVDVLSDPYMERLYNDAEGGSYRECLCNRIAHPDGLSHHGREGWGEETRYLLRIPPNEEAKQLFRETDKPKEAAHG